jgi:hypothetical protein
MAAMKQRSQLKRRAVVVVLDRGRHFPPPDPATRVGSDLDSKVTSPGSARRHDGELIVAAGLGAILVSACSRFVQLVDLPSLSEASVAVLGGALATLGVLQRRRVHRLPTQTHEVLARRPVEVDLPSLTGQLSALLAQLRRQHGVAYRTRTWIDVVLPSAGADIGDPTLARDLLAAAALDAGGIRADVAGLVEAHSRDDIVATSSALIEAVLSVLAACEQSTDQQAPRPSDPSCWPASAC